MTHTARKLQGSRSKSKIRELASAATTSTGSSTRSSPLNKTPAPGWDCGSPGRSSRNTGAPSRSAASALLVRRAERNFPSSCLPLLPPRTRSPESVPWQSRAFAQARGPHKSAFRVQAGPEVFYLNSVNFALGNNFNSPQRRALLFSAIPLTARIVEGTSSRSEFWDTSQLLILLVAQSQRRRKH